TLPGGLSWASNWNTGSSSTAVMPSCWRYGIFSITPAKVPRVFSATPELGCRVNPRTCISYTMVCADGCRSGTSPSQSYVLVSTTTLFIALGVFSPGLDAASRLYVGGTATPRPYGSRRTLAGSNRIPLAGSAGPSTREPYILPHFRPGTKTCQ